MAHYTEKRANPRTSCKVPATIEELKASFLYRARLVNYSKNGMFLETDVILDSDSEIVIGLEDSPFASRESSSDAPVCYRASVKWQKSTKGSIFNFGYGVRIISDADKKRMPAKSSPGKRELRKHPRKAYSKPVYFTSENQFYKGLTRNISRHGIFVKARGAFNVGQTIKLVIPGTKIDNGVMLKGEVIHLSQTGIGVKFKTLLRKKETVRDRGGRRSGDDRRSLFFSEYIPEKRSGQDRRAGSDRRSLKDIKRRNQLDLRDAFKK
ncbi:MAG: PilZ domain-containing protein [Desulfobacterales bacterium]|jgi:hypothetical protein